MSSLEDRLSVRLMPLGAETRKMFGGLCFMLNGNMVAGTFRGELLARVGPDNDKLAASRKGAHPMKMGEKTAVGYWMVPEASLGNARDFDFWIDLALAFNKTLPAKSAGRKKAPKSAGRK
jgi:TfoX/Sxy family transcriptional regulator of competence genes